MGSWLGTTNRSISPPVLPGSGSAVEGLDTPVGAGSSSNNPLTPVFNFPSGFAGSGSQINVAWEAALSGSAIQLTTAVTHQGGSAWYIPQVNVQTFTTDFTFQQGPNAVGITFVCQNSNATTNNNFGTQAIGDANADGYGAEIAQPKSSIYNSIGLVFDVGGQGQILIPGNGAGTDGGSTVTLWINGGPWSDQGFIALNDVLPYGINLGSGHVFAAHVVYDGTLLTLVLTDQTTGAQSRSVWPVNIPAATLSNTAWVGFGGGTVGAQAQSLLTWSYSNGFNSRLATPTFSLASGQYTGTQSVTLSGPSGAALYYTTNGLLPTSASTLYTGAISISANAVLQVVAIQSGFTDSLVATAAYQINTANLINYPSGFSTLGSLGLYGYAQRSGSAIILTDTDVIAGKGADEIAAVWWPAQVNIATFSTAFQIQFPTPLPGNAGMGMTLCFQNYPPASYDTTVQTGLGGGPNALGFGNQGLAYAGLPFSACITFDVNAGNVTGFYTGGANPRGSAVSITGVTLAAGNPLNVTVSYSGTNLVLSITDTVTSGNFSHTFTGADIPTAVGGSACYVGFTAASNGNGLNQQINNWTFN